MLRSIGVLLFAVAITLAACGRQVTGLNPGQGTTAGLQSGQMLVRFRTLGDMNFGQFQYVVTFNTSGNGQEPYANANITGYANYSYAFVITGQNASVSQPKLIQYFQNPTVQGGVSTVQVIYPPQLMTFNTSSNGTNREFTMIFSRSLFNQPNPAASPTPQPTPSPTPTSTPSPNPSATVTSTPTPSPAPTPTGFSPIWTMNLFTTDLAGVPIDALGVNGASDTSYLLKFDVTTQFDLRDQLTKPAGSIGVFSPSAAIAGGEVQNQP